MQKCQFCQEDFPRARTYCPHCGRPQLFPNVADAEVPQEASALEQRYQKAIQSAASRNCSVVLSQFESEVKGSRVVFVCRLDRLFPLACRDRDLYATYYEIRRLRLLTPPTNPADPDWDKKRPAAEVALFGEENKRYIHYASLTLDGQGLRNYGECTVLLREGMIAHRSSTFEENSLLFMKRHKITIWDVDKLPVGFRSNWADRYKLCVAKLGRRLTKASTSADFPKLLLQSATSAVDDDFIEIHVFGPMTLRTFEKVSIDSTGSTGPRTKSRRRTKRHRGDPWLGAIRDMCKRAKVMFEIS